MPSETNRHPSELHQVAHASDMPGSIQAAVRAIEAKDKLIDFLHEDLTRHREEIARLKIIVTNLKALIDLLHEDLARQRAEIAHLKITVTDLKAYIARKARAHG